MPLDSPHESPLASRQADTPQANRSLLEEGIHDAASLFLGDKRSASGASTVRDQVEHYTADLVKAVPLFMIGSRNAYLATALLYGLDQVHTGNSLTTNLEDFALGAGKGALTKGAVECVGGSQRLNWAAKGVVLGASSRAVDLGLTRSTYLGNNGQLDLLGGAGTVLSSSLNPTSLAIDAATFGVAHYGLNGLNKLAGNALLESKLAQNMSMGAIFGVTGGSLAEAQRQSSAHEKFDLGKILMRGGIEGGVMSLASIPGGLQASHSLNIAPETAKTRIAPETMGRSPSIFEGMRTKLSDSLSLLGGKNLGLVYGSGDVPDNNGELVRANASEGKPSARNQSAVERRAPQAERKTSTQGDGKSLDGKAPKKVRTVASVLRSEGLGDYAEALKEHRKLNSLQATRMIGFGNETQGAVLLPAQKGLPEGGVLKVSHFEGGWDSNWGRRDYDARVLMGPEDIRLPSGADGTAHVQETVQVRDRYLQEDLDRFFEKVQANGDVWIDPGTDPTKQLGYNANRELVLIDYSAVGKARSDPTLDDLINGRQNQIEQEEQADPRQWEYEREQEEERQATGEMTSINLNLEGRRQDALADPTRSEAEREALKELFMGESVENAATMWAARKYSEDPTQDFDSLVKQGKKAVTAIKAKATRERLFEAKRKADDDDED